MTNIGEEMSNAHRDVFCEYVTYYEALWPHGSAKLCNESPVTDKAKRLLSESAAEERFTAFDFYWVVYECLKQNNKDCRLVLGGLAKAAELLETYCVNAFLFPWKKEIKTLKTFTGPFVYYVQTALPDHVANNILESIGYHQETDTEYRLSKDADPIKAMRVGFEVFLARQECKYLLEIMGQRTHSECVEVLKGRSSAPHNQGNVTMCTAATSGEENVSLKVDEQVLDQAKSLVAPGTPLTKGCQLVPETASSNNLETPTLGRFISEDCSIWEMRENYPDLTIRQQPIFSKPQMLLADQHRQAVEMRPLDGGNQAFLTVDGMSGPHSMSGIAELHCSTDSTPQPLLQFDEAMAKPPPKACMQDAAARVPETQLTDSHLQQTRSNEKQGNPDDWMVAELTEKLENLKVKEHCADEDLKYPIEETSHPDKCCHDRGKVLSLGPTRVRTQAILCNPSLLPICSFPDCTGCAKPDKLAHSGSGRDSIKEPPQSFYIPPNPSPLGTQSPMLDCRAEPTGDLVLSCPQCHQASVPSSSRSEDELLQTYVLVENDRPCSAFSKTQG